MKKHIKSVVSLTAICAVVAILLALTNHVTAPMIEKQENAAANAALAVVLPDGSGFEKMDISSFEFPETITEVYSEENGGYVFKMTTAGYGPGMVIMCGIDANGVVKGATCISSNETLGAEATYGENLKEAKIDTIDSVDTVASATRTTAAYKGAVKDALNAFVIIGGGSVDLRDEAEILADNLALALPAAEGKFSPVFITAELEGVSAVYSADNGLGYVFVAGESFIATDASGNVISEASAELSATVAAAAQKLIGVTLEEIDLSAYANMPTQVEKAYKASNGNYVFELKASGFGINGDAWYNPSGEHIKIKASATADGKIIVCETVSQKETDGIGSACADASFYSQFNGKTAENYGEIDAISGATITTQGYKTAVSKIFEAIKILKGEA